ncbi:MAG: hypothetical protein IJW54_05500 [Clostridia bacterium]|nr:hypothetical protein [Clostridia bacterium]
MFFLFKILGIILFLIKLIFFPIKLVIKLLLKLINPFSFKRHKKRRRR